MSDDHNNSGRDGAGRFRAGAPSPNPDGRPRKGRGVNAAVLAAARKKVTVTEKGKRTRKAKLDIMATQLANKGAEGDLRAAKMLIDQVRKAEEPVEGNSSRAPVMTKSDHEIVAQIVARIAEALTQGGANGQEA